MVKLKISETFFWQLSRFYTSVLTQNSVLCQRKNRDSNTLLENKICVLGFFMGFWAVLLGTFKTVEVAKFIF